MDSSAIDDFKKDEKKIEIPKIATIDPEIITPTADLVVAVKEIEKYHLPELQKDTGSVEGCPEFSPTNAE